MAILTATLYWKTYFQNILPDSVNGVICVVESSLGQTFTYRIDGKDATFLGMEDLHDQKHHGFALSADYSTFADADTNEEYTGVPVDDTYISYQIHVYPSAEFENTYVTQTPWLCAAAMMFVFVITAAIFTLYDFWVERRQKIVMTNAVQTHNVVSSLFPANVREQVMEQAQQQQQKRTTKSDRKDAFLTENISAALQSSKPIADLFHETSIYFADLAGFTAWSAKRTPVEAFELLEALYGKFDAVASRRRVFKVETVSVPTCLLANTFVMC